MSMETIKQSAQDRRKTLAAWRQGRRHELTLPSGLPVVVRDATIMDLVISGNVPQTLMEMIVKSAEKDGQVDLQAFAGAREFGQLVDTLVRACLIDPAIGETADDDHITLDELSGADKMEIFNWANREVEQAKPFREQPV
jgi:hypothetical protein